MCNLYSMTSNRAALTGLFRLGHNRAVHFELLPAIFPGYQAPVVRAAQDGERELVMLSWGFPLLLMQGKAPRRVTNVRDDKSMKSSFWRPSFTERRCLVPATSFCEPNGDVKPATWHWFALAGKEPRPMFALPGIWRSYCGPLKKDGDTVELEVYSFLTMTPNALVATINHERMPVILTRENEFDAWLKGAPASALKLARQFSLEQMLIVHAGFDKKDVGVV